jgi:DNA-binding MarR family transcriptional regulator
MKTAIKTSTLTASNKRAYLDAMALADRLHRRFLELIETELRHHDIENINGVQALILFNIGEDQPSIGELIKRGYYLGTNATYNVQKMVEVGYVIHQRSEVDRRAYKIKLSPRGLQVRQIIDRMVTRHSDAFLGTEVSSEFQAAYSTLQRLEDAGRAA